MGISESIYRKSFDIEMRWFSRNWDKLLSVFISVILGGVIGFFSAVIALKDDIHNLENDIAEYLKQLVKGGEFLLISSDMDLNNWF